MISILKHVPHLNSITFGYNGEPTLNENILEYLEIASNVREELKWTDDKPLLTLFTNSTTLYSKEIRDRVKKFELVLAKLDSATEGDYKRTNRPHKDVPSIKEIIDSLAQLRQEMPKSHKLALQCLIYNSYRKDFISNNNDQNIEALAEAIKKIKPHVVQIYSVARIPAEYFVFAIDEETKIKIKKKLEEAYHEGEINYY